MARTSVATDDFSGTLGSWTQLNTYAGGTATIDTSELAGAGIAGTTGWATIVRTSGTYSNDQYCKATLRRMPWQSEGYGCAVAARCSGDVNTSGAQMDFYAAVVPATASSGSARNCRLVKVVNGTLTALGADVSTVFTNGDTLSIEAEGTTIRFFKNDVEQFSRTDSDLSSGRPALLVSSISYFDDFDGGDITSATTHPSTGTLTSAASTVAGTATHTGLHTSTGALASAVATVAGTASSANPEPTLTTDALKNDSGTTLASTTIDKLVAIKLSNTATTIAWASQPTNGSGVLSLTHASLEGNTEYLLVTSNTAGTARGVGKYTTSA